MTGKIVRAASEVLAGQPAGLKPERAGGGQGRFGFGKGLGRWALGLALLTGTAAAPLRWCRPLACLGLALLAAAAAAQPVERPDAGAVRLFAPGTWRQLDELPAGRFRTRLETLPPPARERARQWLGSFHFTPQDLASLQPDVEGGIYYVCRLDASGPPAEEIGTSETPPTRAAALPVDPFPAALVFHSRPGAPNVLYLNFAGETVMNTLWNTTLGRTVIPAQPFSVDTDPTTFSDTEQAIIREVWLRVAEDYAPFNVDVTTERPATFTSRTGMALITSRLDANGNPNPDDDAGGVAYVNVFGTTLYARYRPAWIYHDNLGHSATAIAEAAAHELGHNLGLSHDGLTDGTEYYNGHGAGEISWAPLMGTGYSRQVTQWSRGEYYRANNPQDDLALIAGKLTYRPDDHGATAASATPLVFTGRTNLLVTTPDTDPANSRPENKGVLERTDDADWFAFVTGSGPVRLTARPLRLTSGTRGGNLDLALALYDSTGALRATNNPPTATGAEIATNLPAGLYHLEVRPSGAGDPFAANPTGYTPYASLGQYFLSGWITDPAGVPTPPTAEWMPTELTRPGQSEILLTVVYADNLAVDVATLDDADLRIIGPDGTAWHPRWVSVDLPFNGSPRQATYSLSPPDGLVWAPAHNGTYSLWLEPHQVADTEGAWAPGGRLGDFRVAVPRVYYAAAMDDDPGWTLDPLWEYGPPAYPAGGPTTSATGPRLLGYNLRGNYENNLAPRYATTPPINTTGSTALSVRFQRWLRLRSNDTASLEASADGHTWLPVWSTRSRVQDTRWREVLYPLPAAVVGSPTLRLRWGLASNPAQTDLGWHLDDVEVLGEGTLDDRPPTAELTVAPLTSAGSPNHLAAVRYLDETAVRLASLDDEDLEITGPMGYAAAAEFLGADVPGDAATVVATYAIPAPNGGWQPAHNGTYTVTLHDAEVEDVLGHTTPARVLGTFRVDIPSTPPGILSVSPTDPWRITGPPGGPFTPAQTTFTLTNSGPSELRWSVTSAGDWLHLAPTEGVLAPGAHVAVQAALDADRVAELSPGEYRDSLSFLNTSSGLGNTTREVILTISAPALVTFTVTVDPPGAGRVTPAGGTFPAGSQVTLQAEPETWYAFRRWSGDVSAAVNPLTLALVQSLNLTAEFDELRTTHYPTPLWWLAAHGYTADFENAVLIIGANGLPLWQSYQAGLDPADPQSQLRLEALAGTSPQTVQLRWSPVPDRLYTLWVAANPAGPFVPLAEATDLPATQDTYLHRWAEGAEPVFFRLSVRKP